MKLDYFWRHDLYGDIPMHNQRSDPQEMRLFGVTLGRWFVGVMCAADKTTVKVQREQVAPAGRAAYPQMPRPIPPPPCPPPGRRSVDAVATDGCKASVEVQK